MILYHLRSIAGRRSTDVMARLFEVKHAIEDDLVYFASPTGFNDSLDSRVENFLLHNLSPAEQSRFVAQRLRSMRRTMPSAFSPRRALTNLLADPARIDRFVRGLQRDVDQLGVLCLTTEIGNDAMWALYADRHTGVALCFDFPEEQALVHVQYTDAPLPPLLGKEEDVMALLGTKSTCWMHEREHRAVAIDGFGWKHFSERCLRGVVFGWRIDPTHRADLLRWIDRSATDLCVWQARPNSGHRTLGFDVVRAGQWGIQLQ